MFQSASERPASEAAVRTLSVESALYGREVAIVSLAGELDLANVEVAAEAVARALEHRDRLVVVDLQRLEFLDSSGIAMLVRLNRDGRDRERIRVAPSSSPGVSRILAVTGVAETLQIVEDGPTDGAAGSVGEANAAL